MIFLTLLLIPALVALGFLAFSGKAVTLKEFLLHMLVMVVYTGVCMGVIYWRNTGDTEQLNGSVASKAMQRVSCRHPYCCMYCESCTTDSKGNTHCTQYCCMTCYYHPFDQDWNVYLNACPNLTIDPLDDQGLREPPRWTITKPGEPAACLHSYDNYVKAAPGTLFKRDTREDEKKFPLPERKPLVYDYYRADGLVLVNGAGVDNPRAWNDAIAAANARVGPLKQANIVVVLAKNQPREYFEALNAKWLGGKKNDVVLVLGVDANNKIQWADVMAWTYNEMVRVAMRDEALAHGVATIDVVDIAERNVVKYFQRKKMDDFKYLKASFAPTGLQYFVSILIGTLLSVGLGIFMLKNDVFGEENTWASRRW